MKQTLGGRIRAGLAGTPLAAPLDRVAAPFLERYGASPMPDFREESVLQGLARALASRPEAARFLAGRSSLLERVVDLDPGYLERRGAELESEPPRTSVPDLETFLDELRVLRREETVLAVCLDLAGCVAFERVSRFLSLLAETIVRRALAAALPPPPTEIRLCLIGMGKIGGREFTYYSDLDLLFLYQGGTEAMSLASRVARRVISYVSTMTPAGVAYAVDTRLRPSGQQGMLVTSLPAFERYQREKAELWEHLALVRGRAIAGDRARGEAVLGRLRRDERGSEAELWSYVEWMRARIERERAQEESGQIDYKTGAGGLMDLDFLAAGGVLERAHTLRWPRLPSVPGLLEAVLPAARLAPLLEAYALLRRVEARARWVAGRAVDRFAPDAPAADLVAELVSSGTSPTELYARLVEARDLVRRHFRAVLDARTIAALEAGPGGP